MEHGQPLRSNKEVSELLRQVGHRLMIAEREMDAVPIKGTGGAGAAAAGEWDLQSVVVVVVVVLYILGLIMFCLSWFLKDR